MNTTAEVGHAAVAVYADITCPWATIVLHRMRRTRDRLGADVVFDIRPFPLEIVNAAPTPFDLLARQVPVAAQVEPEIGFATWSVAESTWPVTSLPALESVRASYATSPASAEQLDAALRQAFFVDHLCISMHDVVIDCARRADGVDAEEIEKCLRTGSSRVDVFEHLERAQALDVTGSPHVFLANGEHRFLPSLEVDIADDGTARVVDDRPQEIDDLITEAMQAREGD